MRDRDRDGDRRQQGEGRAGGQLHERALARYARSHNDANVLCLGERVVGETLALSILDAFIGTPFEAGRHQRRIDLLRDIENA